MEDSSATGVCRFNIDADACFDEMKSSDDGTADDSGAVYYFWCPSLVWYDVTYVKADNTGAGDGFGNAVSLDDATTRLAVGAWYESGASLGLDAVDDPATTLRYAGAAYLFDGDIAGRWALRDYIKAPNPDAGDNLGYSVVLSGNGETLAVGAYAEGSSGKDNLDQPVGICAAGESACSEALEDDTVGSAGAVYLY